MPLARVREVRLSTLPMSRRLLAVATLATLVATGRPALAVGAKASLESGEACVKAPSGCVPLEKGGVFGNGVDVVAGGEGATVKLGDGSFIEVGPSATVRLQVPMPIPIGPGEPVKSQVVALSGGKARVKVNVGGKVKTAVLLKGPHRTQAIVTAEAAFSAKEDALTVVNLAGKVLATSSNDWSEVPPMKVRTLSKDEAKGAFRDVLPGPKVAGGRFVTTTMADGNEPLTVSWSKVPGAASYEVKVTRSSGERVKRMTLGGAETQLTLPSLPAGSYDVTMTVQDEGGLDGGSLVPVRLAVVGVDLPPGGFRTAPSAVQVAEGQQVHLNGLDGLEMAYDTGTEYGPPQKVITMKGLTTRLIRLRAPGASLDGTLRIEPRSLGADVEVGPKNARWPNDRVTISLKLVNKAGGAVPPGVKMVPEVTLGVTPLKVDFEQEGYTMKAVVAPQAVQLPTVIRVEVKDQHGIYLGRGFLEIAGP